MLIPVRLRSILNVRILSELIIRRLAGFCGCEEAWGINERPSRLVTGLGVASVVEERGAEVTGVRAYLDARILEPSQVPCCTWRDSVHLDLCQHCIDLKWQGASIY